MRSLCLLILAAICVFAGSLTGGCMSLPTAEEIAAFDYGPQPGNKETEIKTAMASVLKDPESARFNFKEPRKYWYQTSSKRHVGWLIPVGINAKNSFGGYTGEKAWGFMYFNDELESIIDPDTWRYIQTK